MKSINPKLTTSSTSELWVIFQRLAPSMFTDVLPMVPVKLAPLTIDSCVPLRANTLLLSWAPPILPSSTSCPLLSRVLPV
ncbi:Uncharacterised protein [Yersinia frederiksenii]|nr:Uncharacterised protein [Yersinia frederiksenii]CNG44651.1 Uncharacterised protein [Yersinia frederiksenii]